VIAPGADWLAQVRALGVPTVAVAFGLTSTGGRGLSPCPSCGATTRHPSRGDRRGAVGVRPDGTGWRCFQCEAGGDAVTLAALLATHGRNPQREHWSAIRRACVEAGLCDADPSDNQPPPAVRRLTPPPLRPPTPPRRPAGAAELWAACLPVTADAEVSAWLAGRAVDAGTVESRDLARALPLGLPLPPWARFRGQPWTTTTHRLIVPMFGPTGRMESVHARALAPTAPGDKAASPAGTEVRGLVMADVLGRLMLAGAPLGDSTPSAELVSEADLWIAEGLPDFLTLATYWSEAQEHAPAVLGVISGSWTAQCAARLPRGCRTVLCTDPDPAGDKYAAQIRATLDDRVRAGLLPPPERWRSPLGGTTPCAM